MQHRFEVKQKLMQKDMAPMKKKISSMSTEGEK